MLRQLFSVFALSVAGMEQRNFVIVIRIIFFFRVHVDGIVLYRCSNDPVIQSVACTLSDCIFLYFLCIRYECAD